MSYARVSTNYSITISLFVKIILELNSDIFLTSENTLAFVFKLLYTFFTTNDDRREIKWNLRRF